MFHPLVKLLATQPELLARHAGAYAALAALQAGEALQVLRRRMLLAAGAAAALLLGTLLAGVAVLLLAVVPVQQMPAAWLLATTPAVPLLLAALLWWLQGRAGPGLALQAWQVWQAQWAADLQLLADAQAE